MMQTHLIVPVVKELIYNTHLQETDEVSKLKTLLKFDRIVMDVMADMLETKAVDECNIFILRNFIYFFSVYAKAHNFLFDTSRLVELTAEEKVEIRKMLEELTDIDDADIIIEKINSLPGKTTVNQTAEETKADVVEQQETPKDAETEQPVTEDIMESQLKEQQKSDIETQVEDKETEQPEEPAEQKTEEAVNESIETNPVVIEEATEQKEVKENTTDTNKEVDKPKSNRKSKR